MCSAPLEKQEQSTPLVQVPGGSQFSILSKFYPAYLMVLELLLKYKGSI